MTMLERQHDHSAFSEPGPRASTPNGAGGQNSDPLPAATEALLRAADEAIRQALEGDSQDFFEMMRQHVDQ
jgi:hypothetical protein